MRRTIMMTSLVAVLLAGCGGRADEDANVTNATNTTNGSGAAAAAPALTPRQSQAAGCFAARVARFEEETKTGAKLSVEQANEAAHYLLLGATANGVTEPDQANGLREAGGQLVASMRGDAGGAALARCATAFPSTVAGSFSGLPTDSPETRTACYGLAFAMAQIWGNSPQIESKRIPRYIDLVRTLDRRISDEAEAKGGIDAQKLLGEVKSGLATALGWGPITAVLDACTARYAA